MYFAFPQHGRILWDPGEASLVVISVHVDIPLGEFTVVKVPNPPISEYHIINITLITIIIIIIVDLPSRFLRVVGPAPHGVGLGGAQSNRVHVLVVGVAVGRTGPA